MVEGRPGRSKVLVKLCFSRDNDAVRFIREFSDSRPENRESESPFLGFSDVLADENVRFTLLDVENCHIVGFSGVNRTTSVSNDVLKTHDFGRLQRADHIPENKVHCLLVVLTELQHFHSHQSALRSGERGKVGPRLQS